MAAESKWRHHGVRVVKADELDPNTAQTPGMNRAAAIDRKTFGTEHVEEDVIIELINAHFDLRPAAIIRHLDLMRPLYRRRSLKTK